MNEQQIRQQHAAGALAEAQLAMIKGDHTMAAEKTDEALTVLNALIRWDAQASLIEADV